MSQEAFFLKSISQSNFINKELSILKNWVGLTKKGVLENVCVFVDNFQKCKVNKKWIPSREKEETKHELDTTESTWIQISQPVRRYSKIQHYAIYKEFNTI